MLCELGVKLRVNLGDVPGVISEVELDVGLRVMIKFELVSNLKFECCKELY